MCLSGCVEATPSHEPPPLMPCPPSTRTTAPCVPAACTGAAAALKAQPAAHWRGGCRQDGHCGGSSAADGFPATPTWVSTHLPARPGRHTHMLLHTCCVSTQTLCYYMLLHTYNACIHSMCSTHAARLYHTVGVCCMLWRWGEGILSTRLTATPPPHPIPHPSPPLAATCIKQTGRQAVVCTGCCVSCCWKHLPRRV